MRLRRTLAGLALLLPLAACGEDAGPPPEDPIRAIKYMVLETRASEQVRKIAGVVEAGIRSAAAFEVTGQVTRLPVSIGDRVRAGDVLAELDAEPFDLAVRSAEAELSRQRAILEDARKKLDQQSQLFDRGFATRTALDTASANFGAARAAVDVAETALDVARRDRSKTVLTSPFDGRVALKQIEVFEEVAAGQPVVTIQTEGEEKIEIAVPETLVQVIAVGDAAEVTFPTLPGAAAKAVVDEIGAQATAAASYPATLRLIDPPTGIRPGMTAEAVFSFRSETSGEAFLIPIAAILPDPTAEGRSFVFVYDEASGAVRRTPVHSVNLRDNRIEVVGALAAGDIIATAGVSFLSDGQKVTLLEPIL